MAESNRPFISLLITDLDNTLFDWLGMWHCSFELMLGHLEDLTGAKREELLPEIREIHREQKTSEYAFLLEEIASKRRTSVSDPRQLQRAFDEYLASRYRHYLLYPFVRETICEIRKKGCPVVAYTESLRYYAVRAVHRLGLDGPLSAIYCSSDPPDTRRASEKSSLDRSYRPLLCRTEIREALPNRKPSREILDHVLCEFHAERSHTLYVGDGLYTDVSMARSANVIDVHAAYGDRRQSDAYELLKQVSHWPDHRIRTESKQEVVASYSIKSFSEILQHFVF